MAAAGAGSPPDRRRRIGGLTLGAYSARELCAVAEGLLDVLDSEGTDEYPVTRYLTMPAPGEAM